MEQITDSLINAVIIAVGIYLIIDNISLHSKYNSIMAKQDQFDAMLQRLDAATTEIADDLRELREEVIDTISDESLAKLDANISKLETMGAEDDQPQEPESGGAGETAI